MFVAISSHEEKSIVLPDGNVALQRDRLTVKPRYHLALAIIAPPISGMFRFVLHFPFLDWLFTGGRCTTSLHDRILRWTFASSIAMCKLCTQASRVALQLCGMPLCVCSVCMEFGRFMADQKRRMAEQNWLCSDKLSTHFLYLISSSGHRLCCYDNSNGHLRNHHTEAFCMCKNLMYEVLVIWNVLKPKQVLFAFSGVIIAIATETFSLQFYWLVVTT